MREAPFRASPSHHRGDRRRAPVSVALVGAGCGGVLVACHLLAESQRPVDLVLIDPRRDLGRGTAYRTDRPYHLLNTRARDMSTSSARPEDFVEWCARSGSAVGPDDFVARGRYGEYLAQQLAEAAAAHHESTVTHVPDEAVGIEWGVAHGRDADHVTVTLGGGGRVDARHVVLSLGPPRPSVPWPAPTGPGPSANAAPLIADPWAPGALAGVPHDARVLLVGTGLTMVDVVLELAQEGGRAMVARSRHGLLPLTHAAAAYRVPPGTGWQVDAASAASARGILRWARQSAEKASIEGGDWRDVVTALRLDSNRLWQALSDTERSRLVRHALRYWDVHRHRMAPEAAARVETLRSAGRLGLGGGRIEGMHVDALGVHVFLAGHGHTERLSVDAVVNCTGPPRDLAEAVPLLAQLVSAGTARRHPLGLGLDVDEHGALLDATGTPDRFVHAIGWARRGRLIETTSVPDIRPQAEALAAHLLRRLDAVDRYRTSVLK